LGRRPANPDTPIAAERRRRIQRWVVQRGSVSVSWLAEMLDVRTATVRNDLDALQAEGKLRRSHGGATAVERVGDRPDYYGTVGERTEQKSWIGEAALALVPTRGIVFVGGGSTIYQFITRFQPNPQLSVVTYSFDTVQALMGAAAGPVYFLGGKLLPNGRRTDCSWSADSFSMSFWDVAFIGTNGLDVDRGITCLTHEDAQVTRQAIKQSSKTVLLCDSSKMNRCSYARVGPIDLVDTIVTDAEADERSIEALRQSGVEIIVAGRISDKHKRRLPAAVGGTHFETEPETIDCRGVE